MVSDLTSGPFITALITLGGVWLPACWAGMDSLITGVPWAIDTGVSALTASGVPTILILPVPGKPVFVCNWHYASCVAGMVIIFAGCIVIFSPFSADAGITVGIVWITTFGVVAVGLGLAISGDPAFTDYTAIVDIFCPRDVITTGTCIATRTVLSNTR